MAYTLEIKRWKKQLDKINCISMFQSLNVISESKWLHRISTGMVIVAV